MALAIILAVVLVVLMVVSFVVLGNLFENEAKTVWKVVAGVFMAVFFLAFILVPFSVRQVNTGEVAVVHYMGEAKKVRSEGTHFDLWIFNSYKRYDSKVQNIEIEAPAYSKDAQTMDLTMTVQYQIRKDEVIEIAKNYGSLEVLESRVQSIATEKAKSVLSAYSAMNIIETRSTISPEVESVIKEAVTAEYHVDIVAVVLTNIDFSDAFEQTVEDKMIAEQEKLKAEYEKETAIINAEKELEVAKLEAQAKLEAAKAEADALIEIAQAEALSLQLKSIEVARALGFTINEEIVTDEETGETSIVYEIVFEGKSAEEIKVITDYLQYIEYLAKWDGKLPTVMTDSSATVVIPTVE